MKTYLKNIFPLLFIASIWAITYFIFSKDFGKSLIGSVLFLLILTTYHIAMDMPRNKVFLWIIALFTASYILKTANHYIDETLAIYIHVIELFFTFGVILILNEILKETKVVGVVLNKYIWLILLVILADVAIIYKIFSFIYEFQLGIEHLLSGFGYTIIKMFLLSAGLISYFANTFKSKKVSYLNGSLAAFFLSDIINIANYLYFTYNPTTIGLFLQSACFVIGCFLLYIYSTYPNSHLNEVSGRNTPTSKY